MAERKLIDDGAVEVVGNVEGRLAIVRLWVIGVLPELAQPAKRVADTEITAGIIRERLGVGVVEGELETVTLPLTQCGLQGVVVGDRP